MCVRNSLDVLLYVSIFVVCFSLPEAAVPPPRFPRLCFPCVAALMSPAAKSVCVVNFVLQRNRIKTTRTEFRRMIYFTANDKVIQENDGPFALFIYLFIFIFFR